MRLGKIGVGRGANGALGPGGGFGSKPAVPGGPIPAAPTALSATTASDTQIDLAWTDNSADETSFKVERSLDGVSFSQVASLPANTVAYSDMGLDPGTQYFYRVRASNANGNSPYSNIDNDTTTGGGGNPGIGFAAITTTFIVG